LTLRPRWLLLAAALVAAAWWHVASRPLAHAPGILVADVPLQQALDAPPAALYRAGASIKPLAKYAMSARVLSRADYRWDAQAKLAPIDLALGWGRMSDSAVLDRVTVTQGTRFYFWRVEAFPIPEHEIIASSANVHLIPADDAIERAIRRTRVGDIVVFDGYLVEADWPNGGKWVSSLSRTDSGAGACELVWVENFRIEPH